jgi:hypothetical protein
MELSDHKLGYSVLASVLGILLGVIFLRTLPAIGATMFFSGMFGLIIAPVVFADSNETFTYQCSTPRTSQHHPELSTSTFQVLSWSYTEVIYRKGDEAAGVRKLDVRVL